MEQRLTARRGVRRRMGLLLALFLGAAPPASAQVAQVPAEQPEAAPVVADLYRIAPGDVIAIRFFFNPEFNEDVQIRPDGRFSMQLVGELVAGGKTVSELQAELEAKYATEITRPRISIQIRGYSGQKVFVTGEVQRPGVVSLIGGQSVLSAIGEAGGVKQAGKTNSAILIRRGPDGKPMVRKLSLGSYMKPLVDASLELQPFDVVIVPPRPIAKLDRWVDEYFKQLIPVNLGAGFQYLYNRSSSSGVSVVPF